ncbi:MAG: hypothetical protein ACE5HV_03290 [Acidobacteriota bacterium]
MVDPTDSRQGSSDGRQAGVSEEAYFRRIEEHFGQRRGGPILLSPRDWQLIRDWRRQGIPLAVVLRGINQAYDRFKASGPRPDRINSLAYCKQSVLAVWETYQLTHAGDSRPAAEPVAPTPSAALHLLAAADACRAARQAFQLPAVRDALVETADRLQQLADKAETGRIKPRDIDVAAGTIEEELIGHLNAYLGDATVDVRDQLATLGLPRFSPYAF